MPDLPLRTGKSISAKSDRVVHWVENHQLCSSNELPDVIISYIKRGSHREVRQITYRQHSLLRMSLNKLSSRKKQPPPEGQRLCGVTLCVAGVGVVRKWEVSDLSLYLSFEGGFFSLLKAVYVSPLSFCETYRQSRLKLCQTTKQQPEQELQRRQ